MRSSLQHNKSSRQQVIASEARTTGLTRISTLTRQLGVSSETIRRDLDELSEAGTLRRVYGGAILPEWTARSLIRSVPWSDKSLRRLAAALKRHTASGQTIAISGGPQAFHVAQQIAQSGTRVTFITNVVGLTSVVTPGMPAEVVLCPGAYDACEDCLFGEETIEYLNRVNADFAVITDCALSQAGASDNNRAAASIKRTMLRRATKAILVVDARNGWQPAAQKICALEAFSEIYTTGSPPQLLSRACQSAGISLTLVGVHPT